MPASKQTTPKRPRPRVSTTDEPIVIRDGSDIAAWRRHFNLRQPELAPLLNMTMWDLSRVERGRFLPTPSTCRTAAKLFEKLRREARRASR